MYCDEFKSYTERTINSAFKQLRLISRVCKLREDVDNNWVLFGHLPLLCTDALGKK